MRTQQKDDLMNIFKKTIAATVMAFLSISANAELMTTDWKVLGDSKSALDTQTGLEWVNLSETLGLAYDNINAELATNYIGWRLPTEAEAVQLFVGNLSGAANGAGNAAVNAQDSADFRDKMGSRGDGYFGAFSESDGGVLRLYQLGVSNAWTNYYHYDQYRTGHASLGILLVSDGGITLSSINNPGINVIGFSGDATAPADVSISFALGGLAMLGLGIRRRKQK
jgi:uncharacterized protein (TIGR03382 family)